MKKVLQLSIFLVSSFCFSQQLLQRFEFENNLTNAANNFTMTNNGGMTPDYVNGLGGNAGQALKVSSLNSFGQNTVGNYRINTGGISNLPAGNAPKAVSFWLKMSSTSVNGPSDIISFASPTTGTGNTPATPEGFVLRRSPGIYNPSSTHSRISLEGGGVVLDFIEMTHGELSNWNWFTISYSLFSPPPTNGSGVGYFKIHVNGGNLSPSIPQVNFDSGAFNTFRIGGSVTNAGASRIDFEMDDLRIWDGMSASQADIIFRSIIEPIVLVTPILVCTGSTVSSIYSNATGFTAGTLQWFNTNGTGAASNQPLMNNTDYDVAQTYRGVLSNKKRVRVNLSNPTAPTGNANQTLPTGSTLSAIVTNITNVNWYTSVANASSNTNQLPINTLLTYGTTYYAVQNDNGCRGTNTLAVTITLGSLSSNDFTGKLKFNLYPNPANSILNIDLATELKQVEIYSLQGQKVLSASEKQINIAGLATGIYMIKVEDENGAIATQKLVKN